VIRSRAGGVRTPARWRRGEWLALLGLVVLVVGLLGPWLQEDLHGGGEANVHVLRGYGASSYAGDLDGLRASSGLAGIGHPWIELALLAVPATIVALVLAWRTGPARPILGAAVGLIVAFSAAVVGLAATALRLLAARPGVRPDDALQTLPSYGDGSSDPPVFPSLDAVVGWGGWVGLAGLLLLAAGLWVALTEERPRHGRLGVAPPASWPVPPTRSP
jgi:hypothetical protein